jgi:hypothetical protein
LDWGNAFIRDFRSGFTPIKEGDVEAFGAEYIWGATSNDAVGELARDEVYAGEMGGLVFDLEDEDMFDRARFD